MDSHGLPWTPMDSHGLLADHHHRRRRRPSSSSSSSHHRLEQHMMMLLADLNCKISAPELGTQRPSPA
eukprot:240119-Lingulodinium_polyedra.AAC.1